MGALSECYGEGAESWTAPDEDDLWEEAEDKKNSQALRAGVPQMLPAYVYTQGSRGRQSTLAISLRQIEKMDAVPAADMEKEWEVPSFETAESYRHDKAAPPSEVR
jgi:hypothetical protein